MAVKHDRVTAVMPKVSTFVRKYGPNGIEKRIAWLEWIAERIPRPRLTHWIRCISTLSFEFLIGYEHTLKSPFFEGLSIAKMKLRVLSFQVKPRPVFITVQP